MANLAAKLKAWWRSAMNVALAKVLSKIEAWLDADQETLAGVARANEAERTGAYVLGDDERRAVLKGLAEVERGEFASDADVEAVFRMAEGA